LGRACDLLKTLAGNTRHFNFKIALIPSIFVIISAIFILLVDTTYFKVRCGAQYKNRAIIVIVGFARIVSGGNSCEYLNNPCVIG